MLQELIPLLSVMISAGSLFYVIKNNKRTDVKEIENRVREMTTVNMKLDEIKRDVAEIKDNFRAMKQDVDSQRERLFQVENSAKRSHERIDELKKMVQTIADSADIKL